MKNLLLILLFLSVSFSASAQTQQGYVKTRGRLVNGSVVAGQRLSGVTVQVKGRNAVVSKANGTFSFPVHANRFSIQNVKKQGYALIDPEAIAKQYNYSANPLILVMETPSQQTGDKLETERKLRRTLTRQLQQHEDEIEHLKEQNKLTEEQYHQALQELYAEQEKSMNLVSQMAERYSRIDFDQLDEFNRHVSECIIEGRLTEADSLIKSKGDLKERIATHNKHHQANVEARKHLEDSEAMEIKNRDDLAQDCYNQFLIHKLQHHPDSAAYYIEQRAFLDTTNVDWLCEAAIYLKDTGNIDNALSLFLKAHHQYVATGTNDLRHALILETIADTYYDKSDYIKAKPFYDLAIDSFEAINPLHPRLVHCYDFLSEAIISTMKTGQKVWDAFEGTKIKMPKGDDYYKYIFYGSNFILDKIYNSPNIDIDNIYFEDGSVSTSIDYKKAALYHERVLSMVDSVYGTNSNITAKVHMSLGKAYRYSGNREKSLENYVTASQILLSIDSLNPELSDLYENMADFFRYAKKDTTAAIIYYQQAIHILNKVYGAHQKIGRYYGALGHLYDGLEEYQTALECYYRALDNDKRVYGENSDWIIQTNFSISSIYRDMGDLEKAMEYLQVNKSIIDQRLEWDSPRGWTAQYDAYYRELGDVYYLQGKYDEALNSYRKKVENTIDSYGDTSLFLWVDYAKIGLIYLAQKDSVIAVENFIKSLELLKTMYKDWKEWDSCLKDIENYYCQGEYAHAAASFIDTLEDYVIKKESDILLTFDFKEILKMSKLNY